MIWIDMEKPKFCWWLDPDNNLIAHKCPFLDREHECILQARINLTYEKRYENCPLHEVTNTDTVSRKAVLDAVKKCHAQCCRQDSTGDEWVHYDTISNEMECLPPSPSRLHDISKAKFSCPSCGAEMEVTVDEWDEGGAV